MNQLAFFSLYNFEVNKLISQGFSTVALSNLQYYQFFFFIFSTIIDLILWQITLEVSNLLWKIFSKNISSQWKFFKNEKSPLLFSIKSADDFRDGLIKIFSQNNNENIFYLQLFKISNLIYFWKIKTYKICNKKKWVKKRTGKCPPAAASWAGVILALSITFGFPPFFKMALQTSKLPHLAA